LPRRDVLVDFLGSTDEVHMSETTRLERTSHVVHGDRSELRLENGHITVVKEATTQARPTRVRVPIERVRNVTLNRPSRGRPGWLHLGVVDGSPAPPSELAATGDPYTLPLTTRHLHAARRLERLISDHVRRRGLPHEGSGRSAGNGSSGVIVNPDLPPPSPDPASPVTGPAAEAGPPPPGTEGEQPRAAEQPRSAEQPPPPPPPPPTATGSEPAVPREQLAGYLRELAELHEAGALSDHEFEQAKRRVLGAD
jgi:hypothetical protein